MRFNKTRAALLLGLVILAANLTEAKGMGCRAALTHHNSIATREAAWFLSEFHRIFGMYPNKFKLTAETCPQYLPLLKERIPLLEEQVQSYYNTFRACGTPIPVANPLAEGKTQTVTAPRLLEKAKNEIRDCESLIEKNKTAPELTVVPQIASPSPKPLEPQTAPIEPKPQPPILAQGACDGLLVSAAMGKSLCIKPGSGEGFRDCPDCPEMVPLPAGEFLMGSAEGEEARYKEEGPRHRVVIRAPFAVGRTHVTRDQFASFVRATGYRSDGCNILTRSGFREDDRASWRSPGFDQTGDHPVVCVNWHDATAYVEWLAKTTRQPYRLLTEAEAEYATRGVTTAEAQPRYFFGDSAKDLCIYANGADETTRAKLSPRPIAPCKDGYVYTAPVMTFRPNAFGLYDVHGNVWTWTQDCWNENYNSAPSDGSAWTSGDCRLRVMRGGSWNFDPQILRAARRFRPNADRRFSVYGIRVARDLDFSGH